MKAFYLLCTAVLLLLTVTVPANAYLWIKWGDQTTSQTMEDYTEVDYPLDGGEPAEYRVYQIGVSFDDPGYLLTDSKDDYHDVSVPNSLIIEGGRTDPVNDIWYDSGYPIYVRILFKAKNKNIDNSDWTDFHLRAIENCTTYKYQGVQTAWDTIQNDYDINGDPFDGWDATYYPDDPMQSPISPDGYFYSETWIQITSNDATHWAVEIWPTPTPEPMSLLLLGLGLGLAFVRRFRCA